MGKDDNKTGSGQGKRTDSGGQPISAGDIDIERAKELHALGMRDSELAQALGVSRNRIVQWRKAYGLNANRIAVWNTDKAMELYSDGAPDSVIASELSKAGANVSAASVAAWRKQHDLPANSQVVWRRKKHASQKNTETEDEMADAASSTSSERSRKVSMPSEPFAPGPGDEHVQRPKEIHTEKKKRPHLVAVAPTERSNTIQEETEPGRRRKRTRVRQSGTLPLAGVFRAPEPDMFYDPDGMMGLSEESNDPEQDAIILLASILHVCRQQFEWNTASAMDDVLQAVAFTEQFMGDMTRAIASELVEDADETPKDTGRGPKRKGSKKSNRKRRR